MGTTKSTAAKFQAKSTSNVRHGPRDKNTVTHGRPVASPAQTAARLTTPIKGPDRGGLDG